MKANTLGAAVTHKKSEKIKHKENLKKKKFCSTMVFEAMKRCKIKKGQRQWQHQIDESAAHRIFQRKIVEIDARSHGIVNDSNLMASWQKFHLPFTLLLFVFVFHFLFFLWPSIHYNFDSHSKCVEFEGRGGGKCVLTLIAYFTNKKRKKAVTQNLPTLW